MEERSLLRGASAVLTLRPCTCLCPPSRGFYTFVPHLGVLHIKSLPLVACKRTRRVPIYLHLQAGELHCFTTYKKQKDSGAVRNAT